MSLSLEPSNPDAEREDEIAHRASRGKIRCSSAPGCGIRPSRRKRVLRSCLSGSQFSGFLVASFFLTLGSTVAAQAPSLIPAPIDLSRVQALPNHHPRWANAANDAGRLPADQPVEGLTLVLARPSAQEIAFEQFLADQQNPASPDYHHWLTAAEIGSRFGPSDADVATIKGWLQSEGLHVDWIAPSKTFIGFGGTAADVSRAFQTELHNYRVDGRSLVSVSSDPIVPQAVAPAIKAIRGLYSIEEDPQNQARVMQMDSPAINASSTVHFIGPGDFDKIYDVPNYPSTGTGEKIGIVGRSRTYATDFTYFQAATGVTFNRPTEVVPTAFGGIDPGPAYTSPPGTGVSIGDQGEATLDVERAGSVAPGAQLLLVVATQASGGIQVDAQYLVQTVPTPVEVMTISFGACESAAGPAGVNFWDSLFQQAAAEGISSFVASGDSGASGCDPAFATPPASPQPNSPNYICSSSYATCVGGTEFNDASSSWSSSSGSLGTTALGYIPEGGWNESWNGTTSTVAASGGGVSSVIATPTWQKGFPGVPTANAGRYTPDVAFSASEHDGYFGCFAAGGGSCGVTSGSFYFLVFSGTSASTPSMAGIAALLDQSMSAPQGNLNPALYQMWYGAPSAFQDVTLASSGVSTCDINTPSMCNNSIPGPNGLSGGQAGYEVGTGYDEVTGLGSLNADIFEAAYPTATKIFTPVVSVNSPATVATNEPFAVMVYSRGAPYGATLTGTFTLTIGSYTSTIAVPNYSPAVFYLAAGVLRVGNYTVTVTYTPDAASAPIYASSSTSTLLTVTVPPLVQPTLSLTPSQTVITNTQSITVGVVVNAVQYYPNPTGSVTLTGGGYSSGPVVLVNQSATVNIPAGSLAMGNDTLTVTYTPDAGSGSSYLTASNFTNVQNEGAKLTPTVFVSANPGSATSAQTITVTVDVAGPTGDPAPTGSVVLTSGSYTSASTAVTAGNAIINLAPGTLPPGLDTLSAAYTPDTQSTALYVSTTGSNTIGVYLSPIIAPTLTVTPVTQNPTTIEPLSIKVTVSGGAGNPTPTGGISVSDVGTTVTGTLSGGSATVTLPAGTFAGGASIINVFYVPDSIASYAYSNASGTGTVNVAKGTPILTITPLESSFSTQQSITVTASVSGGSGVPAPAAGGTVTLTSAYYASPIGINYGSGSIIIPAGSFAPGTDTISAAYSGDNNYNAATATATVVVSAPANASFTLSGGSLAVARGLSGANSSTVTAFPTGGFVGNVALTAVITTSPPGAQDLPTMSFTPASVNLLQSSPATSTLTFTTTGPSSAKMVLPPASWMRWSTASAPVLACIALWILPLRRRFWRNLMLLAAFAIFIAGGVVACGGSGSGGGGGGGGGGNPGTTLGQYTITVTGMSGATTVTNTVTLTVQ